MKLNQVRANQKHGHEIHRYKGIRLGKGTKQDKIVWKCQIPNCPHYLFPAMLPGRKTLCHKCGDEFTITKFHMTRMKLLCSKCRGKEVAPVRKDRIEDVLKEIGVELGSLGLGALETED